MLIFLTKPNANPEIQSLCLMNNLFYKHFFVYFSFLILSLLPILRCRRLFTCIFCLLSADSIQQI
ncbi:hypothetical protein C7R45_12045, partial [Staphylococcus aureus]